MMVHGGGVAVMGTWQLVLTVASCIMGSSGSGGGGGPPPTPGPTPAPPRTHPSLEDEVAAATKVPDRNGFTTSGRSLQKHSNRVGSRYPKPLGQKPQDYNQLAQEIVEDIVTNPKSSWDVRKSNAYGDVIKVQAPDGRAIFYEVDQGQFIGFRE